jgi:hypothetical protein
MQIFEKSSRNDPKIEDLKIIKVSFCSKFVMIIYNYSIFKYFFQCCKSKKQAQL